MSGHNKWSSIKHRKGAQDAKRGKIFSKIIREIVVSVRESGPDEDTNASLRTILAKARESNMPKETIERAIARGSGEAGGTSFERIVFEGYGPSGVAIIVECLTDNRNRTVSDVRHAFSKNGGNLGENGCVAWMFDRKGRLEIPSPGLTEEALMEHIIESSAEDFSMEEGNYVITCGPEDFGAVRDYFKDKGLHPHDADLVLVPKTTVEIADEKSATQVFRLIDALEDLDDVQKVSSNWEMEDALLEKVAE